MRRLLLALFLAVFWTALPAQESVEVPNPPSIPTAEQRARAEQLAKERAAEQGEDSGKELGGVDVKQTVVGDATVTEYSRGGHVHMLKVKPKNMPPQYIDETQPGGQLEPNDSGLSEDVSLPKWKIGSW